ncbi:hypothetical protein CDAR_87311 [Caerostris darwini]|uniref:Uncharacterized protein n=1 Tax=Caerostris darwini TaxID=1538125 RepID=A0AAV4U8F9_9ARAC|nr:hypothetical protein CDAR_87311 [Caerostris darwini]
MLSCELKEVVAPAFFANPTTLPLLKFRSVLNENRWEVSSSERKGNEKLLLKMELRVASVSGRQSIQSPFSVPNRRST